MRSLIALALLSLASIFATGCAMCCAPHDCDYPTYGGRWERTNRTHGRVGSAFDPAGVRVDEHSAQVLDEPTPADMDAYPYDSEELPVPPGY